MGVAYCWPLMATKTAETKPVALDPQSEKFNAAKAQFEAAIIKTAQEAGQDEPKPEAAKAIAVEETTETPEKQPVPQKPKPKIKAPVAKEEPKPSPTDKRLEELSKKLDALVSKDEEPEEDDPFAGVRGKLIEKFGEEDSAAILEAMEAAAGPQRKRLAQLESILKEATKNGRAALSKVHQKRLAEVYPQLGNDRAWGMVHDQVVSLFEKDPSRYSSVDEAYDDVVVSLYGEVEEDDAETVSNKERELEASRIAASTMTPPSTSAKEKPLTRSQASLEVFKHLFKNPSDKAGAMRLARQLKVDRNIG